MISLNLGHIAEILTAKLQGDAKVKIASISTDSRQSCADSLFFALKGENFDAHNYIEQAIAQQAQAVVVERFMPEITIPQLIVDDSRIALAQLAVWLRNEIKPKVIAITGSSGKTTVKEMTAAIMQVAYSPEEVLFTKGNFNNDIGVPLTLLRLTEKHKIAIIELGANHPGEIEYTTKLAKPDVALINNVAAAHLEGFGSLAGVIQAKGEIYIGLHSEGTAIFNLTENHLSEWKKYIKTDRIVTFGLDNLAADFYAKQIQLTETGSSFILVTPQGESEINLSYLGKHNISNAVAAASLAMQAGASLAQIKQGLTSKINVSGRLNPIYVNPNLLLLDDSYNANLSSVKAAIDVLSQYQGYRVFVIGDLKELGADSPAIHKQIAEYMHKANFELVLSFGSATEIISQLANGKHFTDKAQLIGFLQQEIKNHNQTKVVVMAKGSNSMKMNEIINQLQDIFKC